MGSEILDTFGRTGFLNPYTLSDIQMQISTIITLHAQIITISQKGRLTITTISGYNILGHLESPGQLKVKHSLPLVFYHFYFEM